MEQSFDLSKLRNNVSQFFDKRKLKRYYLKRSSNDKTYLAIILDTVVSRIIITVIFFAYFLYMTSDPIFSSILSIQFFILYNLIVHRIKSIRVRKVIGETNNEIGKKKILNDLINKTPYEFIENIKEVLEKGSFEDIKIILEKDIDMIGKLNGENIGIRCYQYKGNNNVDIKDIRDFFLKLRELNIEEGFIITTSSFDEDAQDFLQKLEKYAKLHLVDLEGLIKLMKKAKLYPSEKEIQKYILKKINEKKRKLKEYRNIVLSKGKASKYMIMSVIIYYFGKLTPFQYYYTIVSYVLLALGMVSIIKYMGSLFKRSAEERNDDLV